MTQMINLADVPGVAPPTDAKSPTTTQEVSLAQIEAEALAQGFSPPPQTSPEVCGGGGPGIGVGGQGLFTSKAVIVYELSA